jgi:competence protein ComFB
MSQKEIFLKNYMEDCVWEYLDEVLEKYPEICQCKVCRYDIVALTLNNLPPKYVVREQGELYSKINTLDYQYRIDIIAAITRSVMIVKDKPRHPCDD